MKASWKRILSLILILAMVFSMFASFSVAVGAEGETEPVTYAYNTGKRNVVCTSLSVQAKSYYTRNYTFEKLSRQSASTLKSSLQTLMTNTQTRVTTYDDLRTLSGNADSALGNTARMTMLYSSDSIKNTWDSGKTWNREHVWPQSRGTFKTENAGSDLHHLHPCDSKVNNTRGNLPYGNVVDSGSYRVALSARETISGFYTKKYFEPLDNVKGDIARTLLYVYVRWDEKNLTDVIQSEQVLLDWCAKDPVDKFEMCRNDIVQSIEGNRNVFIDYPEFAWLIFDQDVPEEITTPSGNAGTPVGGVAKPLYTVSWRDAATSKGTGTVTVTANGKAITSGQKVQAGSTIKVSMTPDNGSSVTALSVSGRRVTLSNSSTYTFTLSKNSSMIATWGKASTSTSTPTGVTYTKLTTTPSNWEGDYVLVGQSGSTYYVLKSNLTGTALGATTAAVTTTSAGMKLSAGKLTNVSDDYVFTCKKSGSYYYFKEKNSKNYLAYKASGLTTATTYSGATTLWSLRVTSGTGTIAMNSKSVEKYRLCFNPSSKFFRCYTNNTYKLFFYKAG